MRNLFASTGLGDEKPHERDVEYCGFAGRRPYERQNENPETTVVYINPRIFVGILTVIPLVVSEIKVGYFLFLSPFLIVGHY